MDLARKSRPAELAECGWPDGYDVLSDPFPRPDYDLITCFVTFQYFSPPQAIALLSRIAQSLVAQDGTFVGSVPLIPASDKSYDVAHPFRCAEQVQRLLAAHFQSVDICVTKPAMEGEQCYFTCRRPMTVDANKLQQHLDSYLRYCDGNVDYA